jgi:hypothetical protein
MIVLPACFGPGFPAHRSIGGLFSPLSFYAKRVSDFRISIFDKELSLNWPSSVDRERAEFRFTFINRSAH